MVDLGAKLPQSKAEAAIWVDFHIEPLVDHVVCQVDAVTTKSHPRRGEDVQLEVVMGRS